MSDLGDLYGGAGHAAAYDINNSGQIVGETYLTAGGPSRAVLWQDGKIVDLGPGLAEGINNKGVVIGGSTNGFSSGT
jgi:probable HAF family extracellular repeat protein